RRATPKSLNPSSAATPTSGCGFIEDGARGPRGSRRFIREWGVGSGEWGFACERISMTATKEQKQPGQPAPDIPHSPFPTPHSPLPLMIVAGEASGDKHGAKLVSALRALRPRMRFEFFGAGGDEMRQAGVETLVDAREVAIMGALEVAR